MRKLLKSRNLKWFLYIAPGLILYSVFMAYPIFNSVRLSFFSASNLLGEGFVGFDNYIKLFSHPEISVRYWGAFRNTWIFFLLHMFVQNILGVTFATFLSNRELRGRNFFRTIIFLPATLSIVVTGYLWKLILNPHWGALNLILKELGVEEFYIPWLGNPESALVAVSLVSAWQWIGMPTMMFMAGLNNIPEDLYEAAELAGACRWQIFWSIKLPLLRPVVGIITILTFVNCFNAFDIVFSMANINGAPRFSTDILGTLFYRIGIAGQHPVAIPDRGLGAAIATISFIILALGVWLVMKSTARRLGEIRDD